MRAAAGSWAAVLALGLTASELSALPQQLSTAAGPALTPPKRAEAARTSRAGAIRFDGTLDDPAWTETQFISGFTQREPNEGAPSTDSTSVAFVYDDDALYIGARLRSSSPQAIRALVTRRDREGSSEQLIISLDTFHDRRTA